MHNENKGSPAVRGANLTFCYGGGQPVIRGLNIELKEGETTALTGSNGSGKTTMGKLLAGILKPDEGKIIIFGEDAATIPLYRIGQRIGYCFQNPAQQLFTASVEEEIGFGLKYAGFSWEETLQATQSLMDTFQLNHIRHSFPLNISWGEKRRVILAAILALKPDYLILDEPTTGLDEKRIGVLNRSLEEFRKRGVGMMLISHNESFIRQNAERILRMEGGEIVDDRTL